MDISEVFSRYGQQLALWWNASPDGPYDLWLAAGILGLAAWAWIGYRVMRHILGHRKHRGTWYDETQYGELMQIFEERAQTRTLLHDDMVALRVWKHGKGVKSVFGNDKFGGYS